MGKNGIVRPKMSQEDYDLFKEFKRIKEEANSQGIDESDIKHGWIKSKTASLFFKNPAFKPKEQKEFEILQKMIVDTFKDYSPNYSEIFRSKKTEPHLFMIDPADVHIGKLCRAFESGTEYNQQIAVQRVKDGVAGLIQEASGYNLDKIVLIIGNDILHTDTPKRTTTSGTPQDTDGMWYDNFLNGVKLYVDVINRLVEIADVHVIFNPSNHDYTNGFFLAQLIETHFRLSYNVTFDVDISHRKYYRYHSNLIGTTHGDGAKFQDLPLLMAHESKDWTECKNRYIFTHHVHHKQAKDIFSVCVESLRSPSEADSWHHKNGFEHSPKAIEGFIFHPLHGQKARLTHLF